jgi:acetyl esterase/lipase
MLEDALAAIAAVRGAAADLGVASNRIGVMGSSAGGHLAAHAMVAHGRYRAPVSLRPDFGVLCYPVIAMTGDTAHAGSRENLLGPSPSRELMEEVSPDRHVTASTPPCFLWHTRDDEVVSFRNSMAFAERLGENRVPFELHIYDRGPHGLGMDLSHPWASSCARWIRESHHRLS